MRNDQYLCQICNELVDISFKLFHEQSGRFILFYFFEIKMIFYFVQKSIIILYLKLNYFSFFLKKILIKI